MRTKITSDQYGYVTVTADIDGVTDGPETTTYFVSRNSEGRPGYVRVLDDACRYPQVCERLSRQGNTLMATPETLGSVIRTELRRAKRAAAAECRYW